MTYFPKYSLSSMTALTFFQPIPNGLYGRTLGSYGVPVLPALPVHSCTLRFMNGCTRVPLRVRRGKYPLSMACIGTFDGGLQRLWRCPLMAKHCKSASGDACNWLPTCPTASPNIATLPRAPKSFLSQIPPEGHFSSLLYTVKKHRVCCLANLMHATFGTVSVIMPVRVVCLSIRCMHGQLSL